MNKYKFKITYRNEEKYGHYLEDNRHNVSIIAETLEQAKEKLDKIEKNCDYPCKHILNWDAEEIIQENQQQELDKYKNIVDELILIGLASNISIEDFESMWETAYNKKYNPDDIKEIAERHGILKGE